MEAPNYLSPHCVSGNCSFCKERRRRAFERDFPLLAQPAPGYFWDRKITVGDQERYRLGPSDPTFWLKSYVGVPQEAY